MRGIEGLVFRAAWASSAGAGAAPAPAGGIECIYTRLPAAVLGRMRAREAAFAAAR